MRNAHIKCEIRTSRNMSHFGMEVGFNIACLDTPKLMSTTSKRITKYIMFLTIFPIIVTRGPVKCKYYQVLYIYEIMQDV